MTSVHRHWLGVHPCPRHLTTRLVNRLLPSFGALRPIHQFEFSTSNYRPNLRLPYDPRPLREVKTRSILINGGFVPYRQSVCRLPISIERLFLAAPSTSSRIGKAPEIHVTVLLKKFEECRCIVESNGAVLESHNL